MSRLPRPEPQGGPADRYGLLAHAPGIAVAFVGHQRRPVDTADAAIDGQAVRQRVPPVVEPGVLPDPGRFEVGKVLPADSRQIGPLAEKNARLVALVLAQ